MVSDHRTDTEKKLPAHLGGHFGNSHTDPAVLDYLIARYGITSMLDVGCGPGAMIDLAQERGIVAIGIDGDHHLQHQFIIAHDYTKGPYRTGTPFDLIWCFEFVEHVEEVYRENYLATFQDGNVLYLSTPAPGFGGWHHVNEQPESYWIDLLDQHGFTLDTEATDWIRQHGDHIFSRRQGLVFIRG